MLETILKRTYKLSEGNFNNLHDNPKHSHIS